MPELRQHERLQLTRRDSGRRGRFLRRLASVAALIGAALASGGCISIDVLGGGEEVPLVETVVRGRTGPKILLLDVDGVIGDVAFADSIFGAPGMGTTARVAEMLDRARNDDEVAAILLRIDSPGGTATASEQVYEQILRFKQERRTPVLAQFLGTAASGAYYVAMAADEIQAHPTTVTGSIGVLFTSLSFAGLMEKLGVEDQTLKGGEYKDAGSPFRRLSATERGQLQAIVDALHERFREIVARGRPKLAPEDVERLANGQIYGAREALEQGLVDRIGTLEDAVRILEVRLGVPQSRVVAYHRPREIRRNLYTKSAPAPRVADAGPLASGSVALLELERLFGSPGFHYVWWPGLSRLSLSGSSMAATLSSAAVSAPAPESSAKSDRPRTNIAD